MGLSKKDFRNIRREEFLKAMRTLGCTDKLEKGQMTFTKKIERTGRDVTTVFYGWRTHEIEPTAIFRLLRTLEIEPEELHKIVK